MMRNVAILLFLLVLPFGLTQAQTSDNSTDFTYQGYLALNEVPVNGTCNFNFSLFASAAGADQVGSTVSVPGIMVTNGVFSAQLDFGVGAFNGQDRWLAITVDCGTGMTTLSPRQAITPAAYAMYANSVDWNHINGLPPDFADGVDNDTLYSAGTGLTLTGTVFSIPANSLWETDGNSGTTAGTHFMGTTDNMALDFRVNNQRVMRFEPNGTSPNIVAGYNGNNITSGVYGATISGGGDGSSLNRVTDIYGTISGGTGNQAGNDSGTTSDSQYATVSGGGNNTASGILSTVSGGGNNTASGYSSTIGGGYLNGANGYASTISGGVMNIAYEDYSSIGGGYQNFAATYATVGGGESNTASGEHSTVGGGLNNSASGHYAFAAGYYASAAHTGAFVWSDGSVSTDFASTANNQFNIRSSGGVRIFTNSAATIGVTLNANDGTWNTISDRNAKENFIDIDTREVLDAVANMPVTMWEYIGGDTRHIGPVAQDFYAAFGVGSGDMTISTIDADGVALAAIQGLNLKLQEEVVALQSQLNLMTLALIGTLLFCTAVFVKVTRHNI